MADSFTVDVDTAETLRLLDRVGDAAEKHVRAASRVTAVNVTAGAKARVRRATGQTGDAITMEEAPEPMGGYRVFVAPVPQRPANLPGWIEHGTRYMQRAPFLFNSARLEAGAHERRVEAAIRQAAQDTGLGE